MRIEEINRDDVLVNVDEHGAGYYRVLKVNRKTVDVVGENGNRVRVRPHLFNRRVHYDVPTLPKATS